MLFKKVARLFLNMPSCVEKCKAGLRRASEVCQFGCARHVSAAAPGIKSEPASSACVRNVSAWAEACADGASGSELDAGS